jgi:uroporphyrin-III C-methyltransferase / precorrin-2 dehydrogenase / sirohydrochlorin ferrochelatase
MASLPLFHLVAGRPVIVIGEGAAWEARCRLVERAGGEIAAEDCAAARLAFVALDDAGAAALIAGRLRGRGLLVNVADRPELCDFTVPAVIERDPVVLAVGTGGASAGLAKWLRLRLEALLPGDLGRLAVALNQARGALRQRWPEATARRQALDAALGPGGAVDPFRPEAADRLAGWLGHGDAGVAAECVAIQVRSDDPDDLTLREARLLGCADLVLYGEGVAPAVLARSRADAVRRPAGSAQPGPGLTVVLSR